MLSRPLPILFGCLLLAGCSGEPSEGDMRLLVETFMRTTIQSRGEGAFTTFAAFRKQGCVDTKNQPGSYDCYYAATFEPRRGQKALSVNGKGRFRQEGGRLTFEDLGAQPR